MSTDRRDHTRLRLRLLRGQHEQDCRRMLQRQIGATRSDVWGDPDLSANPFAEAVGQSAVLYDTEPMCTYSPRYTPDSSVTAFLQEDADKAISALYDSGHFLLMQEVQRLTLGLRECAVLLEPTYNELDDIDGVTSRCITPDALEAVADPRTGKWLKVDWYVVDPVDPDSEVIITYDPANLVYAAFREIKNGRVDCSEELLGATYTGEAYPYRDGHGNPVLPWVCYHAAPSPEPFDAFRGREAVFASLFLSVLYSFYGHVVKNAAWAQRYALNAIPLGQADDPTLATGRTRSVVTDPSSILLFDSEEGKSASLGAFSSPIDPVNVLASIMSYEDRVLRGIFGAAVTRQTSDVRSGYSLAVQRESLLEFQRKTMPLFRAGDRQVLSLVAGYLGVAPEEAAPKRWHVLYPSVEALPLNNTQEQ